jgi:hypothetical protein
MAKKRTTKRFTQEQGSVLQVTQATPALSALQEATAAPNMAKKRKIKQLTQGQDTTTQAMQATPMPKMLREADAAAYIGCSVSALQKARCGLQDGPKFFKEPGWGVYYLTSDIDEWADNVPRRRTL